MIRRLLILLFLPVVLYLFAGTLGGLIKTGAVAETAGEVQIGLLRGPIHTDFLLPATPKNRAAFDFLSASGVPIGNPDVAWIVVGWGARDFYTATGSYTDLRPGPVWRAITGDDAVMRVFVAGPIVDTSDISWIDMSTAQSNHLTREVLAGFKNTALPPLDHPGLGRNDLFFPAAGRFHLFQTCNVWVGDVLRLVGARVGIWTPFIWSLP